MAAARHLNHLFPEATGQQVSTLELTLVVQLIQEAFDGIGLAVEQGSQQIP